MFGQRHYEFLADMIRTMRVVDEATRTLLIEEMAHRLGQENPAFKPHLFLARARRES